MRISRVCIENYRNLKHIDVELGNIVTLIGDNNSGKSNFLRAISIPLIADDDGTSKRLLWNDINRDAKALYYNYLQTNKQKIIDGTLDVAEFERIIPSVVIRLEILPGEKEHYYVNDILIYDDGRFVGGILYQFFVKDPGELLERVKVILSTEPQETSVQQSLLPMDLYSYSITIPGKEIKISYDVRARFKSIDLPAERDNFASNAYKLGSKELSDLFVKKLTPEAKGEIEKAYNTFFETVKSEGKLDDILNWQRFSDIPNAQDFFHQIKISPNIPLMSAVLGGVRLNYDDEEMFLQGLGHRNLILIAVLLNSYFDKKDVGFRLMTVEEPEAHLCVSNVLLVSSLLRFFSQNNHNTQIIMSTHNAEMVNKMGLDNAIVIHEGNAYALVSELSSTERDYLSAHPNVDLFKLFYSRKTILVEGITEELLIKSYLQTQSELHDIKVLSFHKGFRKIIDIWKKINKATKNKLGIVRDYDNQPKAQEEHEALQDDNVIVRTTQRYTLETDITYDNFELLKEKYGALYGWTGLTIEQLQKDWRDNRKTDVMLQICHDLVYGKLTGFIMPKHIREILSFMQGDDHAD